LIQGQTDEHIWVGEFDREYSVENLIDIQSGIAQEVTSQLAVSITPEEEARLERDPTENLDAYEAYLLGKYHVGRWDDLSAGASEAARYYQIAIQQDPDLAIAQVGLAGAYYLMLAIGDRAPRETWPQVEGWARSGLAIDSSLALAHAILAELQLVRTWDWEEAERAMERAIELSPSDPLAHNLYSKVLMAQGKVEESLQEANTVAGLDPLSSSTLSLQARWAFYSRRYDEADQLAEVLLTRDPDNTAAAWHLAHSFSFGGHPEDMVRPFSNASADSASFTAWPSARLAQLLSLAGEADSAKAVIDRVLSSPGDEYIDPDRVWPVYAMLGDLDQALFWMERSIEDQSSLARDIGVLPLADPLRDDPRYQALLDRIGLGHLKARFDSLAAADPRGGT
jgi:tetratricopeptide (TPR) repeat protein